MYVVLLIDARGGGAYIVMMRAVGEQVPTLSLLFRVRDALRAAGRDAELEEFLSRSAHCRNREDLKRLADEYGALASQDDSA